MNKLRVLLALLAVVALVGFFQTFTVTGVLNGQRFASQYSGTTGDAKISSAIAALPSGSGTVYADFKTAQSWTACPTWGTGTITLILYPTTYTFTQASTTCTIPSTVTLQFRQGAILSVSNASSSIQIQGGAIAGDHQQVVDPTGAGFVTFTSIRAIPFEWYGAKGDGATVDVSAIQSLINAECSLGNSVQKPQLLAVGGSKYRLQVVNNTPGALHLSCSNVVFGGLNGRTSSTLFGATQGPMLVVAPTVGSGYCGIPPCAGLTVAAPLVAGITSSGGNSLKFDTGANVNSYGFNCRLESAECELNGLTAFTAECYVNLADLTGGPNYCLSSVGKRAASDALTQAFGIGTMGTTVTCTIKTSVTGTVSISAGSITSGALHHIAESWDGSNLRCFLDGVQVGATTAATGTMVQALTESVTLGPAFQIFPESTTQFNSIRGTVDSPRISNNARYTTNFTPTNAKLNSDGNTLFLMNFDHCVDLFCNVQNKDQNSNGYMTMFDTLLATRTASNEVEVRNLQFSANGNQDALRVTVSQDDIFDNLNFTSSGTNPVAMYFDNNDFQERISNIEVSSFNYGIMSSVAFDALVDYSKVIGGLYPYYLSNGSVLGEFMEVTPSSSTVVGAFFNGGGSTAASIQLNDFQCDGEVGNASACIFATNEPGFALYTSAMDLVGAVQPIWIDGGTKNILVNTRVNPGTPTTSLIKVISAPTYPIRIIDGFNQVASSVPWCDVAESCFVDQQGFKTLTFSATPTFDCDVYDNWTMTLTGNVTSSTLSHCAPGQFLTFRLCQDGAAGHTFAWPANVIGGGALFNSTNKCSMQVFRFDGTNAYSMGPIVGDAGELVATALATTPTQCTAGNVATGIQANGNANCTGAGVADFGRTTTVCSTTNAAGNTCTSTVTLGSAKADTLYGVTCMGQGASGSPFIQGISIGGGSNNVITITIKNGQGSDAVVSTYSVLTCVSVGT